MKAICIHRFGGPDVLELQEVPDPVPAADQVVVATRAIGVNPVDTYVRSGKYGLRTFPFTPGTDAAGVVEAVGADVTGVKPGQRVYVYGTVNGAYAQKLLCKPEHVYPLPDRLGFDQGAAIGVPFGTAYRALFIRGSARPNERVLIHGASGGVGTAAVQLAVNHGCRVIGTAGTIAGLQLVKKLGAGSVIDHNSEQSPRQILDCTAGAGVDLIVEMAADKNLDRDLGLLAKRGRVVVVGNRGRVEIDARQTMARDSDIRGMSLMHAGPEELNLIHAELGAGFFNGSLTPIIQAEFPLADAGHAQEAVMKPGSMGKIVLRA